MPRRREQACAGGSMPRYEDHRRAFRGRGDRARSAATIVAGLNSRLMRDNATVAIFEVSMFEAFKSFVSDFVDGEKHPSQFADNDYRLAAAALLVHAAAIDGEMSPRERDKLHSVIKQRFALSDETTDELIAKATAAEQESVDLYHFTSLLNRSLDEPGRARVIEMMWEIVFADGQRDELEDNLLWRAADLLGVSPRERIELRRRIGGESS
jgi:uncharacterized tellurite resistance protein B-like protein